MSIDSAALKQCQRVQVTKDAERRVVNICLERYDAVLGWYTAGALSLPLCQLPMLEQALETLSAMNCLDCPDKACARKIIPFPLLANGEGDVAVECVN